MLHSYYIFCAQSPCGTKELWFYPMIRVGKQCLGIGNWCTIYICAVKVIILTSTTKLFTDYFQSMAKIIGLFISIDRNFGGIIADNQKIFTQLFQKHPKNTVFTTHKPLKTSLLTHLLLHIAASSPPHHRQINASTAFRKIFTYPLFLHYKQQIYKQRLEAK